MFNVAFCEPLENRRHLSTTTYIFNLSDEHTSDTVDGVTATYARQNDKATITVSNLPAHQMAQTTRISGDEAGGEEGGEGMEGYPTTTKWAVHSGSTETFEIGVGEEGGTEDIGVYYSVWQPTVSIGGGGTVNEINQTPINFGVSRDIPTGYLGTTFGDDPIPDTTVSLSTSGTATAGEDYTPTVSSSVTLSHPTNFSSVGVAVKVDLSGDPVEDEEDIIVNVVAGSGYSVGTSTAIAYIAPQNYSALIYGNPDIFGTSATNRLQIDNNNTDVKFHSIRILDNNGNVTTGSFTYAITAGAPAPGVITMSTDNQAAGGNYSVKIKASPTTPVGNYTITVTLRENTALTILIYIEVV